jgi:hypothetical protein
VGNWRKEGYDVRICRKEGRKEGYEGGKEGYEGGKEGYEGRI